MGQWDYQETVRAHAAKPSTFGSGKVEAAHANVDGITRHVSQQIIQIDLLELSAFQGDQSSADPLAHPVSKKACVHLHIQADQARAQSSVPARRLLKPAEVSGHATSVGYGRRRQTS